MDKIQQVAGQTTRPPQLTSTRKGWYTMYHHKITK
ncbi:hypothetical protein Taro_048352 [Colocasia esculenta]|uniref:Uncharacterized protein n=1 Tax=Colocasia esculenta TaxID=4460 RepID=A0A843WY57_COLES|nr:hypothetical protein [Colocasia esculenta]